MAKKYKEKTFTAEQRKQFEQSLSGETNSNFNNQQSNLINYGDAMIMHEKLPNKSTFNLQMFDELNENNQKSSNLDKYSKNLIIHEELPENSAKSMSDKEVLEKYNREFYPEDNRYSNKDAIFGEDE